MHYIAALILLFVSCAQAAEPVMVGVLEEPQCRNEKQVRARIMFVNKSSDWTPIDSSKANVRSDIALHDWTIAFDGRNLGNIRLAPPDESGARKWADKIHQRYAPTLKVAAFKNAQDAFQGWCSTPKARPVVLVSKPNFSDPASWKPMKAAVEHKRILHPALKQVLGKSNVFRCRDQDGVKPEPFIFGTEDLVIYKGYRSQAEGVLISIGLDTRKFGCDGIRENAWYPHWFIIRNENVKFIGNKMELVDAGDYDGDGKSELLFWYSAYNRDGYILYTSNFKKRTEYTWGYH